MRCPDRCASSSLSPNAVCSSAEPSGGASLSIYLSLSLSLPSLSLSLCISLSLYIYISAPCIASIAVASAALRLEKPAFQMSRPCLCTSSTPTSVPLRFSG